MKNNIWLIISRWIYIWKIKKQLNYLKEKNALKSINRKLKNNNKINKTVGWSDLIISKRRMNVNNVNPTNGLNYEEPKREDLSPILFEERPHIYFSIDGKKRLNKWKKLSSKHKKVITKEFFIIHLK